MSEENRNPGYKYGEWRPGKRTDAGKPLKKPGRPKGFTVLNEDKIKLEVGKVVNYMTFGKTKIENEKNKELGIKPGVLTLDQACRELGITQTSFWRHLRKFPEAKELYKQLKEDRREYLKELSEGNIVKGLQGDLGLNGKELMDASFKMLEKTDKAYQPKVEVEQKSISINLHKTTDDILGELADVLGINK